jgi:hypothetical protein
MHDSFQVVTPIGTIEATPTCKDHIHVSGPITVRGIPYRAGIHLYLWNDGAFHVGPQFTKQKRFDGDCMVPSSDYDIRQSCYLTRTDKILTDGSQSAKDKAIDVIETSINVWIKDQSHLLDMAQKRQVLNDVEKLQGERKQLIDRILEIDKAHKTLIDELTELNIKLAGRAWGL